MLPGYTTWPVIFDEAHFIKNNSQRTSHVLELFGVSDNARAPVIGPPQCSPTPMTNLPRDLFNLMASRRASGGAELHFIREAPLITDG
jgi:hypothetical protein